MKALIPRMFIHADIAMIIHNRESGFGRYSDPQSEPPESANHHSTPAHKIKDPAMIFCTTNLTFSEREKVAMKVNKTADKPQSASTRCSTNTTSTPAMFGGGGRCS